MQKKFKNKEVRNAALLLDIVKYLHKQDMLEDVIFYTNGHKFQAYEAAGVPIQLGGITIYDMGEEDVTQVIEFNNPETLTMTFEGPLYEDYNGYLPNSQSEERIWEIAEKYGLYPEQGYYWSLTFYERHSKK
ncbi:MAG: hypothetical protein Q4C61_12635 [Lachnospiraceae bacterium]|nr:hypothetical protein [Lachnospiraceae bacterium]